MEIFFGITKNWAWNSWEPEIRDAYIHVHPLQLRLNVRCKINMTGTKSILRNVKDSFMFNDHPTLEARAQRMRLCFTLHFPLPSLLCLSFSLSFVLFCLCGTNVPINCNCLLHTCTYLPWSETMYVWGRATSSYAKHVTIAFSKIRRESQTFSRDKIL